MKRFIFASIFFFSLISFGQNRPAEKFSSELTLWTWRLYWGGEKNEARELLQKHLIKQPSDLDVTIFLSFIQTLMGNKTEGQRLLNEAQILAKTDTEKLRLVGMISLWLGEDQKAINAFESVQKLDPKDSAALAYLGLALYRFSRHITKLDIGDAHLSAKEGLLGAVSAFKKSLEITPKNSMVYFYLGNTYRKLSGFAGQDKNNEALSAFQNALKIDPHNWEARLNMASTLVYLKRQSEALKEVDYLDKNMPEKKETWELYRMMFEMGSEMIRY
jgi:tetratricopeptide (TPR) repeat protein